MLAHDFKKIAYPGALVPCGWGGGVHPTGAVVSGDAGARYSKLAATPPCPLPHAMHALSSDSISGEDTKATDEFPNDFYFKINNIRQ